MKKDELLVFRGTHYKEMTKAILQRADLAGMIPDREALIGIKPNLVTAALCDEGATTHPQVIEGLAEYLREEHFDRIVVLEGSWVGEKTRDVLSFCGYDELLARLEIPFWDMQEDKGEETDCAGMPLMICERAKRPDFLINVPVVKGHCQTGITCALKNMKGLIPNAEKRRFHRLGLHDPIAHLNMGIRQDFILVDCICPDLTFEDGGNPVRLDLLAAAADPVLADTWGCSVIGLEPDRVGYIKKAARLGAGSMELDRKKIRTYFERIRQEEGAGVQELLYEEKDDESSAMPRGKGGYRHVMKLAESVHEVESCSACYAYLIPALDLLDREGLLPLLKEKICIGQGNRGKPGELGIGNCTALFRHSLKGCPPTEMQMYEYLKRYIHETA